MLMHADNLKGDAEAAAWQNDPANRNLSKAGDDRTPPWRWQGYLYHDAKNVTIPTDNLSANLRQAGAQIKLKGTKTFKEMTQTAIWFEQEHLPIKTPAGLVPVTNIKSMKDDGWGMEEQSAGATKLGFELDIRRVKVGQSKHVRVRPRFDAWEASGTLIVNVDAKMLPNDVLSEIFSIGGRLGLGDYRPGCKTPGRFGVYTSELLPLKAGRG
jgi:hypothetical protein